MMNSATSQAGKPRRIGQAIFAAALCTVSSNAQAFTYVFSNGIYASGTTSPNPLLAPDTLALTTASDKAFNSAFINQSGTVDWQGGNIYLGNGSTIENRGVWTTSVDRSLINSGAATSMFINSGIFRKTAGFGETAILAHFVNSGIIDAQSGTIRFQGDAIFNAGTAFTGSGTNAISGSVAFNGAISSTNLRLNAGYYTGTAATLSGTAQWHDGYFAGDWTLTSGSTLAAVDNGFKTLSAANFTNDGTVNWQGGTLTLKNGSQWTNTGLLDFQNSASINNDGGAPSTFTNGAGGTVHVGADETVTVNNRFVSDGGTLDTDGITNFQGGNAVFNAGTTFTGSGVNAINSSAAFNGAINSTNLHFNAGYYTGTAAALSGTAEWQSGYFTGDWQITNGATLNVAQNRSMYLTAGSVVNNGTAEWKGDILNLADASQFTNSGLVDVHSSTSIANGGGAQSTFINGAGGTVHVDAGKTLTVNNRFVSDGGTLDTDGTTNFQGGDAVFNASTVFTGAGTNAINSGAAFNGLIGSTNLRFNAGYFAGAAAALSGSADWQGGYFTGDWQVTNGSTLNLVSNGGRVFSAVNFVNNGTLAWKAGDFVLANAATVLNNGLISITDNGSANNGGGLSSFVNAGLIQKTAGGGTTTIADGIGFANQGTINVTSGTIALPTDFTNDGILAGTSAFQLSGTLTNNGTLAPGSIPGGRGSSPSFGVGTLTLSGNYLQSASGILAAQLQSSTLSDFFQIRGGAQLGGTLALSCVGGCAIQSGDVFTLLQTASNLSGAFSNVTTTGFLNGFAYNVLYDYDLGRVQLSITDAGGSPVGNVPEPNAWFLLISGFGLLGNAARRRRHVSLKYSVD
jgi:hypothetical protein